MSDQERAFLEEAMHMFREFSGPNGLNQELRNAAWQQWSDWRWAVDAYLKGEEPPAGVVARRSVVPDE